MRSTELSNRQDVIDSRDVIERIEALEAEREDLKSEADDYTNVKRAEAQEKLAEWDESDEGQELKALKELAKEAEDYSRDWRHGETLIRDSYFKEYAQDLADDIGAVNKESSWPNNFIDWDAASDALKQDYARVDFDGVAYWIRSS